MRITFGYNVKEEDDQLVARIEESAMVSSLAGRPGYWLVDSFPFRKKKLFRFLRLTLFIVRFLPSWFPGAGFKKKAREWSRQLYSQAFEPHDFVKAEMAYFL